jgi:hypothetical protein
MSMHKRLTLLVTAAAFTGVMAMVGCGDDEQGGAGTDAGGDVIGNNPETSVPEGGGGDTGGGDGGGDAGCKFNDFVLGLITGSTTATALPSADLGDKCVDDHVLFPASTF